MSSSRCFLAFLVLSLLTLSRPLRALDDWQPISAEDLKMTADPTHPADAVILYHEETSDDNKNHRITYKRLKILTEKGREYANVEIMYSGTDFHVIDVKGRTIAPDGTITPFTGKPYDKTIVKAHGIKYLAKAFTLPNVQAGSIIEWKYTEYWEDHSVYAPRWILQEELPQKRAKFTFIPYHGSADVVDEHGASTRLYHTSLGLPKDVDVKRGNDGRLELELKDVPAFQEEDMAPPADVLKMRVEFFYGTDKMAKPAEFWKEQGKYWNKDVEKFIGHSSAISAAAQQAISPSDTVEQKVRKVYALAQKIKNLTYEEGRLLEELRAEKKTVERVTAEDILRKQEGTRDQVTRVFVAMVRSLNISAFVMRVAPRDETFFQINIPSWRQLTSEIAIVSIDGKETFLDPGTPLCPFGLLEWKRTDVYGARQTPDGNTALLQTPPPDYTQTLTLRVARLALAPDGSATGTVKFSWTGQEALLHRLDGRRTDDAGRKKDMEDEMQALFPPGTMVKMETSSGWDDPGAPLTVAFMVHVPNFAGVTNKRLLFPTGFFQAASKPLFVHSERKYSVYLDYPYRTIDDVQISLPENFKMENLPQAQPIKTNFAIYKSDRSTSGRTFSVRRDFALAGLGFPVEFYGALRAFFNGVSVADGQQVTLITSAP